RLANRPGWWSRSRRPRISTRRSAARWWRSMVPWATAPSWSTPTPMAAGSTSCVPPTPRSWTSCWMPPATNRSPATDSLLGEQRPGQLQIAVPRQVRAGLAQLPQRRFQVGAAYRAVAGDEGAGVLPGGNHQLVILEGRVQRGGDARRGGIVARIARQARGGSDEQGGQQQMNGSHGGVPRQRWAIPMGSGLRPASSVRRVKGAG